MSLPGPKTAMASGIIKTSQVEVRQILVADLYGLPNCSSIATRKKANRCTM